MIPSGNRNSQNDARRPEDIGRPDELLNSFCIRNCKHRYRAHFSCGPWPFPVSAQIMFMLDRLRGR